MKDICCYQPNINTTTYVHNQRLTFVPSVFVKEERSNEPATEANFVQQTCLLPCSLSALSSIDLNNLKSRSKDLAVTNRCLPFDEDIYSVVYENEISKYKRLNSSLQVQGKISDARAKERTK